MAAIWDGVVGKGMLATCPTIEGGVGSEVPEELLTPFSLLSSILERGSAEPFRLSGRLTF